MKKKLLTILTILGVCTTAQSQIHELGVTVGATNYIGDIGSTKYINLPIWVIVFNTVGTKVQDIHGV